ncbi:MAG: hypothetical protein WA843_03865, partial [Candidatus Saccharimonadales bacterium]
LEDLQSRPTDFGQLGDRLNEAASKAADRCEEIRGDLDALERVHTRDAKVFSGFSYDRSKDVWNSCLDDAYEEHQRYGNAAVYAYIFSLDIPYNSHLDN